MKGELRFLSDRVAFSTLQVEFRSNAPEVRPLRGRTRSRFRWVNHMGVEQILEGF